MWSFCPGICARVCGETFSANSYELLSQGSNAHGRLMAMPTARPDARAAAALRRARIDALRMRVAVIAVAGFLAVWAGLFVQLASGHDPGLNDGGATVVQSADPAITDESAAGASDAGAAGEDASAAAAGSGGGASGAATDSGAVVTRQS
ncbi:MAG: hypothetical protein QOG42_1837 [Solirubrobacteraceae bacterium]|nr:hypothetical protein [Solirubrobacteraceae bacterium]